MTAREMIIGLYLYYNHDWLKIFNHIQNKIKFPEEAKELIKNTDTSNYITIVDKDYPEELKAKAYPPFVVIFTEEPKEGGK